MIPGSNVLDIAMTVLSSFTVSYFRYLGRITNEIGLDVPSYAEPEDIEGSLQVVPRSVYDQFGLDFSKDYYTFYVSKDLIDLTRGVSNDKLEFLDGVFICESSNDWFGIDGWVGVLCVKQNPKA